VSGTAADSIPPLVLRCRRDFFLLVGGAALLILALATRLAAEGGVWRLVLSGGLYLAGALTTQFFLRFCLASLELSDHGFRVRGPFHPGEEIAWREVREWRRKQWPLGPGYVIVFPTGQRRVTVPLLYEDAHLLPLGLRQGGFPSW
jgi:hypothetical protein